jgi:membrane peptidoglycan carboxypeptidase
MQTTLARRQRHRRSLNRRPTGRSGTVIRSILIAIPVVFVLVTIMLAGAGALFTVAAYNFYAQGLPDPQNTLNTLKFDQQTIVNDRTGKVELARLGTLRREVIGFKAIPEEMLDATTAVEDQGFWTNPGFDPSAIVSAGLDTLAGRPRGASTITQQLVRARLLPPEAFADSTYERKIREIIQSIRLTDAYPGDKGKQDIITAYLNQNFYGNQTYGVKAAAKGYFGKQLDELSLAQYAILAAIPQSPTRFDLMRNAEEVCLDANPPDPESDEVCKKSELQVPMTSEIVQRRNYILDLMKSRSPLSGSKHTAADYEAAKEEPVVIKPQASANWRAAHFVWQVRDELATILCPDDPADCEDVDTGGYRVTTTLDWSMQKIAEKWTYVAARAPHSSNPRKILRQNKIPASEWGWILGLRGRNIHNAASAVMDYRTGEVLAYVGSARYAGKGNRKYQPQFDVLAKGWRQPGSSIKPIDYAIGIDDETYTAATMFMDVVTDFGRGFTPTQADKKERGPVRLRSALQFSLNIPAIKSTIIQGLDHTFERSQDFGLAFPSSATPVTSMGIGTLETHPIDMLTAYGAIANGGVRMPRQMITKVVDENGKIVWPLDETKPEGVEVISPQAAYIVTDILAGNTVMSVNKYWGEWAITTKNGRRRPAAYKTGTTSDNRDVHAYGYLAPPTNKKQPALAVGVWMGNSNNAPNNGSLSLDSSAPLWSAILSEVSNKLPVASFKAPAGLVTAQVDAFTGLRPGPFTKKTVKELFIKGTVPRERETLRVSRDIDSASGLLWRDGCAGPKVTRGFFNLNEVESNFPNWQKANRGWAARAAKGPGTRGGPEGTRTSYFYDGSFTPFGRTWGVAFAPTQKCPIAPKETPPPVASCDPLLPPEACISPSEPPKPGNGKPPKPP